MAKIPHNYSEQYYALPLPLRRKAMQQLRKWGNWTKTTAHRKLAGESVAPIEEVLLDGVLKHYSNEASCQQEISFEFDLQQGVIPSPAVFCSTVK